MVLDLTDLNLFNYNSTTNYFKFPLQASVICRGWYKIICYFLWLCTAMYNVSLNAIHTTFEFYGNQERPVVIGNGPTSDTKFESFWTDNSVKLGLFTSNWNHETKILF